MRAPKVLRNSILLLSGALSFIFYYTNCYRVVGTGNPRPNPSPRTQTAQLAALICAQAQECQSGIAPNCLESVLESPAVASGLGLVPDRHLSLNEAMKNETSGELAVDAKSVEACGQQLKRARCLSPDGSSWVSYEGISIEKLSITLSQTPDCRRSFLDHVEFTPYQADYFHNLQPFGTPPVFEFDSHTWLGILSGAELGLFQLRDNVLSNLAQVPLSAAPSSWFWHQINEKKFFCVANTRDSFIECRDFSNGFNDGTPVRVELASHLRGRPITDAQSLGNGDMVVISNAGQEILRIDPNFTVTSHPFDARWGTPKSIVASRTLGTALILFQGRGVLALHAAPPHDSFFDESHFLSIPDVLSIAVANSRSESGEDLYLAATFAVTSEVTLSKISVGPSLELREITRTRLSHVPQSVSFYQLSGGNRGLLVTEQTGSHLTFAFFDSEFRFSRPILVNAESPILGIKTGDLNGDGHDDLFLEGQDTSRIWVLLKN